VCTAQDAATPPLGVAFLGPFDSFSIDNVRHTLLLNWTRS
jgi:hypothetical protein